MRRFLLTYYLFLVFFFSFFASGFVDSQDGFQYLAVARNIYYLHEPTAPVYEFTGGVGVGKNIHMSTHVGKDGKTYSATGLGFSLAMVPAVAITDLVYRVYNVSPPVHFPLENDWLILLLAGFTNIFFASGIGVALYAYLREVKVKHKAAVAVSFIGILATNLIMTTKHVYAHPMFTFFLFVSFLMIKIHARNKNNFFLLLSGIFLGITIITYNISYFVVIIPYLVYFLIYNFRQVKKLFFVLVGVIPFYIINNWYVNLTAYPISEWSGAFLKSAIATPVGVLYEGLYGQLLSPGRSYFIYSPLILLPILFWHKIKKNILPETINFVLLFGLYVMANSLIWLPHPMGFADPYWHGEYSWGPRYLFATIPFGLVLVGYLYSKLKIVYKIVVFAPLVFVGLFVNLLGVTMHHQIKFHHMQPHFVVNGIQYVAPSYINFLPRFSPLIGMSKNLIKMVQNFPKTIDNGVYNVRFFDGVDFAFSMGQERWRTIDKTGYILFDDAGDKINSLSFDLINHPIDETNSSAFVTFLLNEQKIATTEMKIGERKRFDLKVEPGIINKENNLLALKVNGIDYDSYFSKKQFVAIVDMFINGNAVNKESIDVPYISSLGPAMTGISYQNWGSNELKGWMSWHIHTQVAERTPYFWWMHPFYYWDIPVFPYIAIFLFNIFGLYVFGKRLFNFPAPK